MFAQIIRGKVSDPAAVRAGMDRWVSDLAPTAVGWLGSTTGVSERWRPVRAGPLRLGSVSQGQ